MKQLELRAELNDIFGIDEPTEEEIAKLHEVRKRLAATEAQLKAVIETEANDDQGEKVEKRETRTLVETCSIGSFIDGILRGKVDGAERELQEEYELRGDQIPIAMLETRAVTPIPNIVSVNQAEILPVIFPRSVSAFLGVAQPTVPVGTRSYPVLTTGATAGTPAKKAAQAETTGEFTVKPVNPGRIQASFFYGREDAATFRGMDASLRQNLSEALSDKLDERVVAGVEAAATASDQSSKVVDFTLGVSSIYSQLDGIYADMVGQVGVLAGKETYTKLASVYSTAGDQSALDIIDMKTRGARISTHIGAVAANKQNAIARLGMRMDAVAPVWEGITIINDEVTKADTGEIKITAIMLYGFSMIRAAAFKKVTYKVS
ncbi:MAG: hypothetical protein OXG53_17955 [Chloroflexi bacterium]|nr:hypothetical protein [Chloroflexota bacterium]